MLLIVAGMFGFLEPAKRVQDECEYGNLDAGYDEFSEILEGQCASNLPSHRIGCVHQQDQMIPLGYTVIDLCHEFGFSQTS
jgi:hypothetical protein